MKTRAAVSTTSGVSIEEIELLEPRPTDCLVRVEAANVAIVEAAMPTTAAPGVAPGGADGAPGFPPGGAPGFPPPGGGDFPAPPGGAPGFPPPGGGDLPPFPGGGPGQPPGAPEGLLPPDMPSIPTTIVHGHAGVGVVEEVGPAVTWVKVGDRVLMTSNPNCGICRYCLHGRPDQCANMVPFGPAYARRQDGSEVFANGSVGNFAELSVIPETQLTPVTTDLPADQLALIANPVATGVGSALIIAPIRPGSVVAVVGCGSVGLSYIQAAKLALAEQIIAIDPLPHRRQAALRFGATTVIDPTETDAVQAVRELTDDAGGMFGRGADYAFEAAGDPRAMEKAFSMTRLTGHVTLAGAGTSPSDGGFMVSFPAMEFAIGGGKTVHSCQWGGVLQRRDFPWLIRLAERGQLDVAAMAERSYPLKDIHQALEDVAARSVIGASLLPNA